MVPKIMRWPVQWPRARVVATEDVDEVGIVSESSAKAAPSAAFHAASN